MKKKYSWLQTLQTEIFTNNNFNQYLFKINQITQAVVDTNAVKEYRFLDICFCPTSIFD